jgi:hypothetical protein
MAEHSKTHLWINTAIASLALLVAAGSAIISYRTFNLSTESIGISGTFTYDCPLSFGLTTSSSTPGKHSAEIGLCWKLTVANQSTARSAVVRFWTVADDDKRYQIPANMLTEKGTTLPLPLILDGGEARTLIARISVAGTPLLERTVQDFAKANPDARSLADFAYFAAQANLDALGNPIETQKFTDDVNLITFPSNYKSTNVSLQLMTGRNHTFNNLLVFPAGHLGAVSPSKLRQR